MARYKPVDYDPFAPTRSSVALKPVDYDPFAPKGETSFLRDVGGALVRGTGSQVIGLPGVLYGLATGDMDNVSTRAGKAVEEFGEELQTQAFRERQRQQAERVAEAEKEGLLSGFGQQAKELLTDPLSLAAGVAQTLPAMIGTGGFGLAGRAAATALAKGQIARQATVEAAKEAAKLAAKRGTRVGTGVGTGALIAGDTAQSTYERVKQMPADVVERSEPYRAAIAEGATPEEARESAAVSAARRAAATVAPIATLTGPFGLEAALLTGGLRRGFIRGGLEGLAREGGQELIEETGQGFAENVGAQAIDPNVALTEDLGGRAAAGLILGGTMGAGAGAVSGLRGPEAEPGIEPPPPQPTVEPEPVVPATSFGVPLEAAPVPVSAVPEENVIIEDDLVIIESPDGSIRYVPREEYDEAQRAAAAPPIAGEAPGAFRTTVNINGEERSVEGPVPRPAPTPAPTSRIFQPSGQPAPTPTPKIFEADEDRTTSAPTPAPPEIGLGTGSFEEYLAAARASKPAPPPSDTSNIFQPSGRPAPEPVRISMPPYVRPPEFKVGLPAPEPVAEPVAAPVAEPVPAPTSAPAPAVSGFKTAMGSTYEVDEEGRTTRDKAKRDAPGHEADFGRKPTSAKTVYVDSADQAASLSAAGLSGLGEKGARVVIKDGKATLLTWNDKESRWGTTPSSRDIPVYSEPAVGRAPLELWKPADDVPGNEAYRGMHAGNIITETFGAAPAPTPAKPPRARKLPAPPKAATTMQAYIAQIAKTFKKGQDRYSFESAVDAGVDPDWLNSRADLRRMFGKEKLTRGRDGKVIQNQRQINENLKSFSDLAMGFQPKDWGLYGESLDENGYVLPEALADLINSDAPRYDPTTGRPYEREVQEEDYGLDETIQRVSREASDLGVDLTDADMRAIAERIGYDGDPLQGIVDYVNEQFEEVMAEARDYSEYDAGQEEFPDGPVTNIEDSIAEPGVSGQAAAPGDASQGQADREQPAGAAPQVEEGSLGLSAEQAAPQGGMTERQRAEMQARLQQSQMRRGNQEALDQQEGGMFDASRDQDGLFKSVEAALPAAQAEALEEARKVPSLSRGVRKLLKQWGAGRIDDGMLASNIADLAEYIDYMKDGRNYRLAQKGRARGADRIMEALLREKRRGNVSAETVDFVEWALKANPNLAENLAISVRAPGEKSPAGQYDHVRRLMTLFKNRASDTTAVHEMLHHTERMMPPDVQAEIRKTWLREFNKAAEKGKSNAPIDTFFQALRALHGRTKFTVGNETFAPDKGLDIAINLINQGFVPYSYYQYVNPSEFWAVNATDIMRKRFDVKDSTLARIRNWLSELAEKAKGLFNLSATSPLIKALDSLAKADGKFNSLTMLQEEGARYLAPRRPPSGPPPSGPQPSLFPSPQPPSLTLPEETRLQRYSRKLVDRFERLRVVQSLGQLAAGIEGFYEAARKFDSRAGELMQKFERDFGKKIKEIARKAGFGMNDIDLYLYSKAAPEINADFEMREIGRLVKKKGGDPALMTKVNGTNPNFDMNQRERDWNPQQPRWSHPDPAIDAAILAQYKKPNTTLLSGSGISNKDAFDEVDPLENGAKGQAWKDIAKVHRDSVKWALDNDVARGVKSRKIADEMLKAIPHYVPVKGATKPGQFLSDADFALMDDQGDSYDEMMSGGAGFSITKNEWSQRRGRKTLPFSPYGTFMSDVGARIVRGERNRVGQKMMDFFIKNPSNEWRVFSDRNPPRDRNGNIRRPDPRDPNFMVVKRGGETFYLRINDPLLAKAAKNLNPTQMNAFLEFSNKVTRLLSRSFTTANPDFFVPNVFRDLQSAALNLGADSPGLAKAFSKNIREVFKAKRTIAAFEYGMPGGDPAMRDQYEQFKLDGGSVSWAQRETPQEAAARIQDDLKTLDERLKDIKDAKGAKETIDALWKPTSKGFRAMVGALESTNAIFENGIRFAAYRAAIDVGMTREQAAMISREATVDFNRRGEAGALLNALYAFFNAGIQGSVRTARALSNNPFKTGKLSSTQAALLGMMATAATLAAANAAISDEDDDGKLFWDKIPDYEKERNLILMNPFNGRSYLKIPMPYGFGFFPYLATRTMDAARRGDDFGAAGMDIVTAALGNFSPVQFSAGSVQSSGLRAITPTVFKPLTELALNENFMGKPIYNEPFDRGQSYASVARYNTPEGYKEFSQFLNDISGGEGKIKGGMNFPAESFEYLLEFGLGGVTQLAKSIYKTGAEGEPFAAPVLRRLVGQPGKGRNVGEYYEREEQARVANQQLKDSTGAERRKLIEKFPVETSPRVQSALTSARSAVRKLNEERKRIQNLDIDEGAKAERLEALRERIDGEFVRFNRVYNQVEEATR